MNSRDKCLWMQSDSGLSIHGVTWCSRLLLWQPAILSLDCSNDESCPQLLLITSNKVRSVLKKKKTLHRASHTRLIRFSISLPLPKSGLATGLQSESTGWYNKKQSPTMAFVLNMDTAHGSYMLARIQTRYSDQLARVALDWHQKYSHWSILRPIAKSGRSPEKGCCLFSTSVRNLSANNYVRPSSKGFTI